MTLKNIALLVCALTFPSAAVAGEAALSVNGVVIPEYIVDRAVKSQLAQGQKETPELQKAVREILINQEVVAQAAVRAGLDKQPAIAAQLQLERTSVLANAYFADYLAKNPIPEDAMRAEYEKLKTQTPTRERHVRHILVASEQDAANVIKQLAGGASFEKLAAERSQDAGTKERGGDLGWGQADRFPKPFADAVSALAPGTTSQAPVQTQFGYHVIRVDEERATTIATYEQAKPQIQQLLQGQAVQKLVAGLRTQARIAQ